MAKALCLYNLTLQNKVLPAGLMLKDCLNKMKDYSEAYKNDKSFATLARARADFRSKYVRGVKHLVLPAYTRHCPIFLEVDPELFDIYYKNHSGIHRDINNKRLVINPTEKTLYKFLSDLTYEEFRRSLTKSPMPPRHFFENNEHETLASQIWKLKNNKKADQIRTSADAAKYFGTQQVSEEII